SGGRMIEPVTRNCLRPQLVTLPPALLRTGDNLLDVRVLGHPLQRVASRQAAGGLSALEVGPQSALQAAHAARLFWGVRWVDTSSLILIGVGCVLIAVGWLNRREVYFTYLGWLCLAWVVLALAVQFFLSFAGLRSRVIENVAALQWVVLPTSLILAGPDHLFPMALFWYFVLAIELVAVMAIYLSVTLRQ